MYNLIELENVFNRCKINIFKYTSVCVSKIYIICNFQNVSDDYKKKNTITKKKKNRNYYIKRTKSKKKKM